MGALTAILCQGTWGAGENENDLKCSEVPECKEAIEKRSMRIGGNRDFFKTEARR
jgi:hypothetical protein